MSGDNPNINHPFHDVGVTSVKSLVGFTLQKQLD